MKRVLDDHRSSMTVTRLSSLTILAAYKSVTIDMVYDEKRLDKLVTDFDKLSNRRIRLR